MTMFGKPKNKYLSDIISIRSPHAASVSVRELSREYRQAQTKAKKLRIARATQLAANRAIVLSKKRDVSPQEKVELSRVSRIYAQAAGEMFDSYRRSK